MTASLLPGNCSVSCVVFKCFAAFILGVINISTAALLKKHEISRRPNRRSLVSLNSSEIFGCLCHGVLVVASRPGTFTILQCHHKEYET